MQLIKNFLHKLLHHQKTLAWVFVASMTAIMLTYNMSIRFGLSEKIILHIMMLYPIEVVIVYCLRTYFSLPLVLRAHRYYPGLITENIPAWVSRTASVMLLNVTVMMAGFTALNQQLYPDFLPSFAENWVKSYFVAVPVFFLVVRPLILFSFRYLKARYPIPAVIEVVE
ncbi:hypothetical protein [Fructobacillus ficulneus]|uniref:Uncharacterized protein n=1 Tax=Fructobacillus ficulneus TaxID=157463 RepID=A0A0K8MG96_9LACO|nr:hypothetical protein [Fructobacillus ficulneus]GAO99223.1 hypothetical protein FFIC_090470 [Fructobacillus ficulneus]